MIDQQVKEQAHHATKKIKFDFSKNEESVEPPKGNEEDDTRKPLKPGEAVKF